MVDQPWIERHWAARHRPADAMPSMGHARLPGDRLCSTCVAADLSAAGSSTASRPTPIIAGRTASGSWSALTRSCSDGLDAAVLYTNPDDHLPLTAAYMRKARAQCCSSAPSQTVAALSLWTRRARRAPPCSATSSATRFSPSPRSCGTWLGPGAGQSGGRRGLTGQPDRCNIRRCAGADEGGSTPRRRTTWRRRDEWR